MAGSRSHGRRRRFAVGLVVALVFAAGLLAAGAVAGSGPLSTLISGSTTDMTSSLSDTTKIDQTTTGESTTDATTTDATSTSETSTSETSTDATTTVATT